MSSPLISEPPFNLSAEAQGLLDGINQEWQAIQTLRAEIESERNALSDIQPEDLRESHLKAGRKIREAVFDADRRELSLLRRFDAEWPAIFHGECVRARAEAFKAHAAAEEHAREYLLAGGWVEHAIDRINYFRAAVMCHPDVIATLARSNSVSSYVDGYRHDPSATRHRIQQLELELRGRLHAA